MGGIVACCIALLTPVANDSAAGPQVDTSVSPAQPAFIEPPIALVAPADENAAEGESHADLETINQRRQELDSQIAAITARLVRNETDRKTAEAKMASLTTLLGDLPDSTVTPDDNSNLDSATFQRQQLAQLESQAQGLSAKMNENHPRLAALRLQIADGRQKLANQEIEKRPAKTEPHARRQSLESALVAERTRTETLTSGERQLIETRAELRGELAALTASSGTNIERHSSLAAAAAPRSEPVHAELPVRAKFEANDAGASSLIPLFEWRRLMVLALGLSVALAAAIGSALMPSGARPHIMSALDFEAVWDLPLIGVIPNDRTCPMSGAGIAS